MFACEPDDEPAVRRRISEALRGGQLDAVGRSDRWTTVADQAGEQAGELDPSDAGWPIG